MRNDESRTNDNLGDSTDIDHQPTEQPTGQSAPGWPRWAVDALAWLRTATTNVRRVVMTDPAGAAALVVGALVITAAVVFVVGVLVGVLNWLIHGHPAHDIAAAAPAVRIVTHPIGHWLAGHTAGLPLPVPVAAWIWGGTGFVLFACAAARHLGAQLLWPLYGAATAAMAWSGTPVLAHRPVVVGLLAVAWSALSLLALHGRPQGRPQIVRPARSDQD